MPSSGVLHAWLVSFALTQLIEIPILAYWLRARPWPQRLGLAFGASAITHPILWFVIDPLLRARSYEAYVLVGEAFAIVVEAWYLRKLGAKDALLGSSLANAASWLSGRGLRALGWL